jgi:hypothetical protein
MPSKPRKLKKIRKSHVKTFKIRNRSGYAAICLNNLTEGRTSVQAVARLANPLKRMGYCL